MDRANASAAPAGNVPAPKISAVDRLRDIREHQSLAAEFAHNWRGWLGSVVFHATVLVLLVTLTWGAIAPRPVSDIPIINSEEDLFKPLDPEDLDKLLPKTPVKLKDMTEPDLPFNQEKPSPTFPAIEPKDGLPDYIGRRGTPEDGDPGGGRGGRRLGGWEGVTGKLRKLGWGKLDVVFVFDSTGSMGGIILEVKTRIRQFISCVSYFVPETRLGIVTYRDKKKYDLDDYEYTARYLGLTGPKESGGMEKIQRFLRETEAYGGGDIPEAVYDGVEAAIGKMNWRADAKKVIIIFGDAPPRPEDNGVSKLVDMIRVWHDRTGGVVSCIDTTGSSKLMDEFKQMAESGGGRSCFLNDERAIVRQILISVFPKELETDMGDAWDKFFRESREKDVVQEK